MIYTVYFFGDNSQYRIFLIITQFENHFLENTEVLTKLSIFRIISKEKL